MITQTDIRLQFSKENSHQYNTIAGHIPQSAMGLVNDDFKLEYIIWLEEKLKEEWNKKE